MVANALVCLKMIKDRHAVAVRMRNLKRQRIKRRRAFALKQSKERTFFLVFLALCYHLHSSPLREVWVHERSSHWWEDIAKNFSPQAWIQNFRMSQDTFTYLCSKLKSIIAKEDTIMRKAIVAEKRLGIAVWFLATGADYRTIGHLFGVSKATVCVVVKEVCSAIVQLMLPQYIRLPGGNALKAVIGGFKTDHGFPQCGGAVDGTHIPIVSPHECPADYYNRKGFHSILMQGVVDDKGLFTDIYIGWPGRVHDARVFANSSLYHRGNNKTLFPNWVEKISGTDVPIVLLGDPAYPLLPWLMKAFPDTGNLTRQQKKFNYRLSKARVVVEHSYGKLKGRWRCLLKRLDVDVCDVPELVSACCVLHNVCEVHGDQFDMDWMDGVDSVDRNDCSASITSSHVENDSTNIRNALMTFFNH